MDVYILGAGASKSYNKSKTGVRMPLAKDFFKTYNSLKISEDLNVVVTHVLSYLKEYRKMDYIDFMNFNEDIEAFLTEINEKLYSLVSKENISYDEKKSALYLDGAYNQLIFLFEGVLNEIQNGEKCPYYTKLLEKSHKDDVFITFNWDTLLDRVLWESKLWSPEDGYGITFAAFYNNEWQDTLDLDKSKVKLLKLHGSTNWIIPYFGYNFVNLQKHRDFVYYKQEKDKSFMYCYVDSINKYKTYKDRCESGYAPFSYYYYPPDIPLLPNDIEANEKIVTHGMNMSFEGTKFYTKISSGEDKTTSMPLIIPPVKNKDYSIIGGIFEHIWEEALKQLCKADKIYIIGYSFPITDTKSWDLMQKAKEIRNQPLNIEIVNPFPDDLAKRFYETFGNNINCEITRSTFADFVL